MYSITEDEGWAALPGMEGLQARLLSGDFNEAEGRGFRTRVVRFDPGAATTEVFSHLYWEEVSLVSGSLFDKTDGVLYEAPCYVLRPPGTPHGPYLSESGCVLLETQYFAERTPGEAGFLDAKAP